MFALMTGLWCLALVKKTTPGPGRIRLFTGLAIAWTLYGVAMEFVQRYWIPNRSFDLWDIVADGAGCGLGLFLCTRYIKK